MKTQYVWIVLERWNLDLMETDACLFSTEALAQAYAKAQASAMRGMIDDSVVRYDRDGCFVCVEKEDGYDDEWWEARIVKRGINYEERKK